MRDEVKKAMEKSKYFLIYGSKSYFDDYEPEVVEQIVYAKLLGKPFRVVLQKGIKIPPEFFDGVKDYKVTECDIYNEGECVNAMKELCRD